MARSAESRPCGSRQRRPSSSSKPRSDRCRDSFTSVNADDDEGRGNLEHIKGKVKALKALHSLSALTEGEGALVHMCSLVAQS